MTTDQVTQCRLRNVLKAIKAIRLAGPAEYEADLHEAIAEAFGKAGIYRRHEVDLGPGNRIDFVASGSVGVEVKKSKPNSRRVAAQVARYCASPEIDAVVIVVEGNLWAAPSEVNGKPVRYVSLTSNWGVAL